MRHDRTYELQLTPKERREQQYGATITFENAEGVTLNRTTPSSSCVSQHRTRSTPTCRVGWRDAGRARNSTPLPKPDGKQCCIPGSLLGGGES